MRVLVVLLSNPFAVHAQMGLLDGFRGTVALQAFTSSHQRV